LKFEKRRQKKCNNGIRNRGLKQQLCLENKKTTKKALRQKTGFEIIKLAARSSVRIPKMSVKALWRRQPLPK
jgi:hypothetical protein